jgi:hypothetical protein
MISMLGANDLTEARFPPHLDDIAASPQVVRANAPPVGRHVGAAAVTRHGAERLAGLDPDPPAALPGSGGRVPPHPAGVLEAARATLKTALREEGEALVSASDAVKASGVGSAEAARALRSAEAAHARVRAATLDSIAGLLRIFGRRAAPMHRDAS